MLVTVHRSGNRSVFFFSLQAAALTGKDPAKAFMKRALMNREGSPADRANAGKKRAAYDATKMMSLGFDPRTSCAPVPSVAGKVADETKFHGQNFFGNEVLLRMLRLMRVSFPCQRTSTLATACPGDLHDLCSALPGFLASTAPYHTTSRPTLPSLH
jgi:hypothetical protein